MVESYEKQKRFITDAGHEIKTPLAIISADVDVLEMEYGENEWLEGIQTQVKRLASLTNDLVYLSRMEETEEKLQMIEFPFSDVVSETAQSFQGIAQATGKQFQCSVVPMLSLNGNEKAIRQLVSILLDNAMKYSPEGGKVALSAEKQGRYIHLSVWNTTVFPVEKQNLSHIFERFYRLVLPEAPKPAATVLVFWLQKQLYLPTTERSLPLHRMEGLYRSLCSFLCDSVGCKTILFVLKVVCKN